MLAEGEMGAAAVSSLIVGYGSPGFVSRHLSKIQNGRHKQRSGQHTLACHLFYLVPVRHVTGNDKDYLRLIPRVVW